MLGRGFPTRPAAPPRLLPYTFAVGVGSNPSLSSHAHSLMCPPHFAMLGDNSFPWVVGVGQYPHSIAPMRRTDVPSSQHPPSSVIPQAGKSLDDGAEATGT